MVRGIICFRCLLLSTLLRLGKDLRLRFVNFLKDESLFLHGKFEGKYVHFFDGLLILPSSILPDVNDCTSMQLQ